MNESTNNISSFSLICVKPSTKVNWKVGALISVEIYHVIYQSALLTKTNLMMCFIGYEITCAKI